MYECSLITNGYLLTDAYIRELRSMNCTMIQITIDGDRESHNNRRFLQNGLGTYDRIVENLLFVVKAEIPLILRINVNEENIDEAQYVLDIIPEQYRSKVIISVANLFQNEKKINPYVVYKKAIELGYEYKLRNPIFMACHACLKNGIVISPNGKLIICENVDNDDKELGYIDEEGHIVVNNVAMYYKLKTISALQNPTCRKCKELPLCIASCRYKRTMDNQKCIGMRNDGLALEERAKLCYLYDINRKRCGK